MLGANAVPGGRCAIAWSNAGPERVVLAPTTDSRWDEVVFAVLAALETAVDAAPDNDALRLHLAGLLVDAGEAQRALDHCAKILARHPDHAEALTKAIDAG